MKIYRHPLQKINLFACHDWRPYEQQDVRRLWESVPTYAYSVGYNEVKHRTSLAWRHRISSVHFRVSIHGAAAACGKYVGILLLALNRNNSRW